MKKDCSMGYATIITIITISLLAIIIFGLLSIYSLNNKMVQSNESSTKAFYLGESGITVLKNEIDSLFEKNYYDYLNLLNYEESLPITFKEYVLQKKEHAHLEKVRQEVGLFDFYLDPHGWRLEAMFREDDIALYSTGYYREARKRIEAIISYPSIKYIGEEEGEIKYYFIPSEILVYYQGYEGEHIE